MADIRTLKLALLADTKDFIAGLDKADKETKTFSNKLDDALQKGAAAFLAVGAAAGAMAIKIGIDAVKAAVEDEKAQTMPTAATYSMPLTICRFSFANAANRLRTAMTQKPDQFSR